MVLKWLVLTKIWYINRMWWGETVNYTYRYQICSGSTAILDDCLEKLGDGVPYKLCHNQNCWDLSKKCL